MEQSNRWVCCKMKRSKGGIINRTSAQPMATQPEMNQSIAKPSQLIECQGCPFLPAAYQNKISNLDQNPSIRPEQTFVERLHAAERRLCARPHPLAARIDLKRPDVNFLAARWTRWNENLPNILRASRGLKIARPKSTIFHRSPYQSISPSLYAN